MGRDKAFVEFGGRTLLERAADTLRRLGPGRVSVVLAEKPAADEAFPAGTGIVTDTYRGRGTPGALHAALSACRERHALVLACDLPFVTAELLGLLLDTARREEAACVAPVQPDGIVQPLCAVYEAGRCLKTVTAAVTDDDDARVPSARELLRRLGTRAVGFDELAVLPGAEHFFFNLNTPADLARAERILRGA